MFKFVIRVAVEISTHAFCFSFVRFWGLHFHITSPGVTRDLHHCARRKSDLCKKIKFMKSHLSTRM